MAFAMNSSFVLCLCPPCHQLQAPSTHPFVAPNGGMWVIRFQPPDPRMSFTQQLQHSSDWVLPLIPISWCSPGINNCFAIMLHCRPHAGIGLDHPLTRRLASLALHGCNLLASGGFSGFEFQIPLPAEPSRRLRLTRLKESGVHLNCTAARLSRV